MHLHTSQVAGGERELGDRLRYGGGNMGADILGGYIGSVGTGSTFLAYGDATAGGGTSAVSQLTRVIVSIAVFWVVSIMVLILLHKAGFRFSLTVG